MATLIVENATNEVVYILPDDRRVVSRNPERGLFVLLPGGQTDFGIADLDINDVTVVQDAVPPADIQGRKYTYTGGTYTMIPGWVNPRTSELAEAIHLYSAAEIIEAAATLGINLVEA
jgi:hypothetical protein